MVNSKVNRGRKRTATVSTTGRKLRSSRLSAGTVAAKGLKAPKQPLNERARGKAGSRNTKTPPNTQGKRGLQKSPGNPRNYKSSTALPKPKTVRKLAQHRKKRTYELTADDDLSDVSFGSGLLDENVCFTCGLDTKDEAWDKLILCDACEGEYHLSCVGLDLLPRRKYWHCPYCIKDSEAFHDVPLHSNSSLQLTKTSSKQVSLCYTPSKPLEVAWEECLRRGYMCVKGVFSHDIIQYVDILCTLSIDQIQCCI